MCFREIWEVCCREGRGKCCREAGDRSVSREAKLVKPLEGSNVEDLVTVKKVQIKNIARSRKAALRNLIGHNLSF